MLRPLGGGAAAPTSLEFRTNDLDSIGTGIWAPKTATNARFDAWQFAADADIQVALVFTPPSGWTAANIDIHWYGETTAAGNVAWRLDIGTLQNDVDVTTVVSTGSRTIVPVAPVTGKVRKITTLGASAAVVAGRDLYFKIVRVGTDAGDTYASTAHLFKVVARKA